MIPKPLSLEERLQRVAIEDRSVLQGAIDAKRRLEESLARASDHRMELMAAVWTLRKRGVPAKTIAMAVGASKAFVVRCRP